MSPVKSNNYREIVDSETINDEAFQSNAEFVTSKAKPGRPRKAGRALDIDNVVVESSIGDIAPNKTISKNVPVKRLVNFQPRSSKRLCKL